MVILCCVIGKVQRVEGHQLNGARHHVCCGMMLIVVTQGALSQWGQLVTWL